MAQRIEHIVDLFDDYKREGHDLMVSCPMCDGRLGIDEETEIFKCHSCDLKGNRKKMMSIMSGDISFDLPSKVKRKRKEKRAFEKPLDLDTLSEVEYRGCQVLYDAVRERYVFPYIHPLTQKLVGLKYRSSEDSAASKRLKYWYEPGSWQGLYIPDMESFLNSESIVLTEGEMDAKSINSHTGLASAATSGCQNSGGWPLLSRFSDVVILFDNDEPGREGAEKAYGELTTLYPGKNIFVRTLPDSWKDYNEMYQDSSCPSPKDVCEMLGVSPLWGKASSVLEDSLRYLKSGPEKGLSTGYPAIDELTGGIVSPSYVAVHARPGAGKTTLLVSIAHNLLRDNVPVGIASLEQDNESELLPELFHTILGHPVDRWNPPTVDDERVLKKVLGKYPLWLYQKPTATVSELVGWIKYLYLNRGVRVFMVDHLLKMEECRSEEYGRVMRVCKDLSDLKRTLKEIALYVVIQPKTMGDRERVTKDTMRYIQEDEWSHIWLLNTHKQDIEEIKTRTGNIWKKPICTKLPINMRELEFAKIRGKRYGLNVGEKVYLLHDSETNQLSVSDAG